MIELVITGGQTGADIAGWRAAKACGIPTGGWMPKHFAAEDRNHPEFAELYGAKEMPTDDYPPRTRANIAMADALLWFGNPHSPGGKLTLRLAVEANIDQMVVVSGASVEPHHVAEWIAEGTASEEVRVLMIAGNRESKSPSIEAWAEAYLWDVFRELKELAR